MRGVDGNIPLGSGVQIKELNEVNERKDVDSISTGGYTTWALNNYGLSVINTTGITKLGVALGFDITNTTYTGGAGTSDFVAFHTAENASGTTKAPKLIVSYIPAGAVSATTAIFFGAPF